MNKDCAMDLVWRRFRELEKMVGERCLEKIECHMDPFEAALIGLEVHLQRERERRANIYQECCDLLQKHLDTVTEDKRA